MDATTRTLLVTAGTPVVSGSTYLVTTELLPAGRPLLTAAAARDGGGARRGGRRPAAADWLADDTARPRTTSTQWHLAGSVLPVKTTIDAVGRVVVPKPLRDALGLTQGAELDISRYGAGLQLIPAGRTARLVDEDGVRVVTGSEMIDDDVVFGLLDAGRR